MNLKTKVIALAYENINRAALKRCCYIALKNSDDLYYSTSISKELKRHHYCGFERYSEITSDIFWHLHREWSDALSHIEIVRIEELFIANELILIRFNRH